MTADVQITYFCTKQLILGCCFFLVHKVPHTYKKITVKMQISIFALEITHKVWSDVSSEEKNAVTSCEEQWKPCSHLCATQQRFNGAFKCNRGSKKYVIWRTESLSSSDQEVWAQTCCHHCSKWTRCQISTGYIWHVHLCSTRLISVAVQTLGRSSRPAHRVWVWTET